MAYSVGDDEASSKCKGLDVPVVFWNRKAEDTMEFGTGNNYETSETQIRISDNSHPITEDFSTGLLTVQSSAYISWISGWSQDVTKLAEVDDDTTQATVLYLEKGDKHIDESTATERIVFFGAAYYHTGSNTLTTDGETLVDNCIEWAVNKGYSSPGTLQSAPITPTLLAGWDTFTATHSLPTDTSISYKILDASDDSEVGSITSSEAAAGYDISTIASGVDSIKLYALLSTTDSTATPVVNDWKVTWGTVNLVINEVKPVGTGSNEWIEFYNKGSAFDIGGYKLTDQDSNTFTFPSRTILQGQYIIVHTETETNDTVITDNNNDYWDFYWNRGSSGNVWADTGGDDVLLYAPDGQDDGILLDPIDYMAYGSGGDIDALPSGADANPYDIGWTGSPNPSIPTAGQSIGRNMYSTDTDAVGDWESTGGIDADTITPGYANNIPEFSRIWLTALFVLGIYLLLKSKSKNHHLTFKKRKAYMKKCKSIEYQTSNVCLRGRDSRNQTRPY